MTLLIGAAALAAVIVLLDLALKFVGVRLLRAKLARELARELAHGKLTVLEHGRIATNVASPHSGVGGLPPVKSSTDLTPEEARALRVALIFGDPAYDPRPDPDSVLESAKHKLRRFEGLV